MERTPSEDGRDRHRWGLIGALGATAAASACCIGPLLLLFLGVGGAWVGNLTALAPWRPYFILLAAASLGLAFYRVYGRRDERACEPGSRCADPRVNRLALWIVTALVAILLALPYALPHLVAGGTATGTPPAPPGRPAVSTATGIASTGTGETDRVVLEIGNMTCASCVVTVRESLIRLDGVEDAAVTLDPPRAVVAFDRATVTPEGLIEATTRAGFPSRVETEERN